MENQRNRLEIVSSLAGVLKGLSALFWALPLALLSSAHTGSLAWTQSGVWMLPILFHGLVLYGLISVGRFRQTERAWVGALDRAKCLALTNVGLAPFLYYWNLVPGEPLFRGAVTTLAVSGLLTLYCINLVLFRLSAMLPDAVLQEEAKVFTQLNRRLLGAVIVVVCVWIGRDNLVFLPLEVRQVLTLLDYTQNLIVVSLVLLPLALTLTLIWKTKEVIFNNVFGVG